MGNLGPYQDIVTAAKKAGGVPSLVKIIESKAVSKAAPAIFAKGVGAGAALAVGSLVAGKKFLDKRKTDQAMAAEAKDQLAAEVDRLEGEAGDDHREDDTPSEPTVDQP